MNWLDLTIITFLNNFTQHSWVFDKTMVLIGGNIIFKGGVIIPILWWLWFRRDRAGNEKQYVLATLAVAFFALVIARLLALALPFRPRPLHNPSLDLTLPFGLVPGTLDGWSSFPSDHAVLFFALATGIYLLSPKAGVCAFLHAIFIVSLPRIYLGLHHFTDILGGAAIGMAMAGLVRLAWLRRVVTSRLLEWEGSCPGVFYACFLVVSYQLIFMFEPLRMVGQESAAMAKHILSETTFIARAK